MVILWLCKLLVKLQHLLVEFYKVFLLLLLAMVCSGWMCRGYKTYSEELENSSQTSDEKN